MELVRNLVGYLARPGRRRTAVVLCHAPSGLLLTDGSGAGTPIHFESPARAEAFRTQWLDEADAWEPLLLVTRRAA